jgi:hypothetical protein
VWDTLGPVHNLSAFGLPQIAGVPPHFPFSCTSIKSISPMARGKIGSRGFVDAAEDRIPRPGQCSLLKRLPRSSASFQEKLIRAPEGSRTNASRRMFTRERTARGISQYEPLFSAARDRRH